MSESRLEYRLEKTKGGDPASLPERALWLGLRQALLAAVDAIERYLELADRTAELRRRNGR